MRIKRKLIAAMMTGLTVMLSAALLGGTLTVATSVAKSTSHAAKAKHKKHKSCPKGTKKQGKACIKTKVKVEEVKHVVTETEVTTVTSPKEVLSEIPGAEEVANARLLKEEEEMVHPGLWPTESTEKGSSKAIENASEIPPAPKFNDEELNAWPAGNWVEAGGGTSLDRYSVLSEINRGNVANLKSNWMIQLDGSGSGEESPAGEYNGVLYYETGVGDVFAVSVKSGKILWVHLGELIASSYGVCCGQDTRGVALWNGLIYVGTLNASVEALEMKTGKLVWYAEVGYATEGFGVNAAPLVYHGMVFIGATGAERSVRGFMEALNAETGAIIWKKYNIPGPGEYGHETWPTNTSCVFCNYSWATGGAAVWNAPAVDPETGDIIYAASNAGGQFAGDYYGQDRAGANLWTDSFLARHALTGNIAWGFQTTHHDIWDYDMSSTVAMIQVEIGGKKVTDVAQATKNGYAYDLEATTGAPQTGGPGLGIEEKPVPQSSIQQTFPTQPIPKPNWMVNRLVPSGTPCPLATPVANCPTISGAASGNGSVKGKSTLVETEHQIPASKTVPGEYEESQVAPGQTGYHSGPGGYPCYPENTCAKGENVFQLWGNSSEPILVPGEGGNSGDRQGGPSYNPKDHIYTTCAATELEIMNKDASGGNAGGGFTSPSPALFGQINAYDAVTGSTKWEIELPHECYAGFLTTATELLFFVNSTGQFYAYDQSTGKILWQFGEESNLLQGCKRPAAKAKGYNPRNLEEEVPVGPNKKGETVWCHHEQSVAETELNPAPNSATGVTWKEINKENFEFGNPGLGAGGSAPPMTFEFEGKQYIVIVAAGGGLSGQGKGTTNGGPYMWEFSLTGSGAQKPLKEGEAPIPEFELCPEFKKLREEHKTCGGF